MRGLKRNRRLSGTFGANRPGFCAHTIAGPCHAFDLALFTALWIILKLFIVKKELFAGGKDEVVAAVRTFQNLVDEIHTRPPEHALEFSSFPSTKR